VSVRKQYSFWPGEHGLDAWDVDRLIELTREFEVHEVALSDLSEIDSNYWSLSDHSTVREVAEHVMYVNEADLSYPIILAASGRIMDGMHRVVRALLLGQSTIRAVRFVTDPDPDYRNCTPEQLPY
jgi:hypothetical protein